MLESAARKEQTLKVKMSEYEKLPEKTPFKFSTTKPIILEMRIDVNAEAIVSEYVGDSGDQRWALVIKSGEVKTGVKYFLLEAKSSE